MWFRKRSDRDFQAEVASQVRLEADRSMAEGVSSAEAEAAARRAFGNVSAVHERFYESLRRRWLDQLTQDLRYGSRTLWKYRRSQWRRP